MFAEQLDGLRHFRILKMSGAINEEKIFPRLALAGAGLNLRHIDLELVERGDGQAALANDVMDSTMPWR